MLKSPQHDQPRVRRQLGAASRPAAARASSLYSYLSEPTVWPLGTYRLTTRTPPTLAASTRRCGSSSRACRAPRRASARARQQRHAVVGLLPGGHALVAGCRQLGGREGVVGQLGFLQRDHVRRRRAPSQSSSCGRRTRSELTFQVAIRTGHRAARQASPASDAVQLSSGCDVRLAAAELDEGLERIAAAAAREDAVEEALRRGAVEDAALLEGREGVGRQHLGPLVAVVAGRVAAGEDVAEAVREAVPLRHRHHRHLGAHLGEDLVARAPPRAGSYSACRRKSNSANSTWRSVCSPAWKLRVAMQRAPAASAGSGAPVAAVRGRCAPAPPGSQA